MSFYVMNVAKLRALPPQKRLRKLPDLRHENARQLEDALSEPVRWYSDSPWLCSHPKSRKAIMAPFIVIASVLVPAWFLGTCYVPSALALAAIGAVLEGLGVARFETIVTSPHIVMGMPVAALLMAFAAWGEGR